MPRVISDELFDQLMGCVKQQRLLGVMGMLERVRDEAISASETTGEYITTGDDPVLNHTWEEN